MQRDPLTITDRLQYGLIALAFGAVIGALAAVAAVGLFASLGMVRPFNLWLIGFSAVFFFGFGYLRGSEAADTVADALMATGLIVWAAFGALGGGAAGMDGSVRRRSGFGWVVFYMAAMALLALCI
ncbi:hypothetical protein ACDW_40800 [Acidovorax sp. DW039]|uniref:hypothetical protein n=1 Tax=Acidovorax sp. DW039 TaxID=3095606 RepID=UPI00308C0042|nr:hypothetical protein ACDW_40800 [Acidovorax sp. DW039]